MIISESFSPLRLKLRHFFAHAYATLQFRLMPLSIVNTNRFHSSKTLERPAEAGSRILPSRKKDKGGHFSAN